MLYTEGNSHTLTLLGVEAYHNAVIVPHNALVSCHLLINDCAWLAVTYASLIQHTKHTAPVSLLHFFLSRRSEACFGSWVQKSKYYLCNRLKCIHPNSVFFPLLFFFFYYLGSVQMKGSLTAHNIMDIT